MARKVHCVVDDIDTDGLDFPPWPSADGLRVYHEVGKPAWQRWMAHQTILINEYRITPMNPEQCAFLEREMVKFLFEGQKTMPPGYHPAEPEHD